VDRLTSARRQGIFAIEERTDTAASPAPAPSVRDYADVGDRVSAVLKAAEEAATQIRADAERAAEATRREAEREAERYAGDRRRDADGEIDRAVAAARADAEKIRETARAAARRVAEEGHSRLEELRGEARALERRFESAIDDLWNLITQLEAVVPAPTRREGERSGEGERSQPAEEAGLAEALRPGSERAEAPRESEGTQVDAARANDGERPPS
jgi:hypothetical protein